MNKVHNIDDNNNINMNKNKFKLFKNARLSIVKKFFSNKVNSEQNSNIKLNTIKYNCLRNIFIKFSPKYKYHN